MVGSDIDPPTAPARTDADARAARSTEYQHLGPLFAELARLPADHPRREPLRAELIAGYLPVARNIAHKYGYRGDNPEDVEQVAAVGLVLAVDRYDPDRAVEFLSFAVPTINGEVLRYFRDRATIIRTPRRLRALQSMIHDAAAELAQRHGRAARPSQIAEHLGIELTMVLEALSAQGLAHTASLDEPAPGDAETGDRSRFDAALAQIEQDYDLVEYREALTPLLAALPERERRILLLRFVAGLTQTEIGHQIGISQMHVSRLLSRTLTQLHRDLTAD